MFADEPPSGLSTYDSIENVLTTARVWQLPGELKFRKGVWRIPDAPPAGHYTIGPTEEMSLDEFLQRWPT